MCFSRCALPFKCAFGGMRCGIASQCSMAKIKGAALTAQMVLRSKCHHHKEKGCSKVLLVCSNSSSKARM